ncbi:hypothetical protein BGZ61DRAFT_532071 [Ilyonectria robusta]|uniref:uncharacterized protein n=1 Tax=Ilyonectria robusta TaxID=1079257 RepID=UPI001E8DC97D|nr:uncharacterized protein BGZ61DRAFT_532071 [Ilyonectria robusta]KAH8699563.1 hypothetical protein BGZ61DRAFT_532071 [Ilyonectria robusta]
MDAPSFSNTSSASSAQQSPTVQMVPQPVPAQSKTSSTDVFLKEFNLVAEAAKRAQMAVMQTLPPPPIIQCDPDIQGIN